MQEYCKAKNIVLVESPLQLINAYEALHYYRTKNTVMFVRYSNLQSNDKQIDKLLSILRFPDVQVIKFRINPAKKNVYDIFNFFKVLLFAIYLNPSVGRVFVGNYDSGFFSVILKFIPSNAKIVLLDDGNKSIRLNKELNENSSMEFFTTFNLSSFNSHNIVYNDYPQIKTLVSAGIILDKSVLFVGSGMAEIGIVSEEYYLELMADISNHYAEYGFNIIYIPHRAESSEKLNLMSKYFDFEIRHLDYPIELFGLFNGFSPFIVSSFCSTAIITLRNIYGYTVECFSFDYIGHADEKELDELYRYYQTAGIKVKSL